MAHEQAHTARTEKQKMLAGELYSSKDDELRADARRAQILTAQHNSAPPEDRYTILQQLFGACGEGVIIRPGFACDYGYNIYLEDHVFMNFNVVLLDVMPIRIGANTQIGPFVQIYAADHPRDPAARQQDLEFGRPVTIGKNVWIGGGAILLPGITVGDNAIIGAGTVVTRNIPPGQTIAGNPGKPIH